MKSAGEKTGGNGRDDDEALPTTKADTGDDDDDGTPDGLKRTDTDGRLHLCQLCVIHGE